MVPQTLVEALDPDWLTEALAPVSNAARVTSVETVEVIRTVATKVRFTVTFDGSRGAKEAFCLKGLLDVDADLAKDLNRGGMSALMFAARDGHIQTVRTLLAIGADIEFTDPDGSTALLVALMNGQWDTAKLLIDAGADVNLWDWWGQSPLYLAVDMNTLPWAHGRAAPYRADRGRAVLHQITPAHGAAFRKRQPREPEVTTCARPLRAARDRCTLPTGRSRRG